MSAAFLVNFNRIDCKYLLLIQVWFPLFFLAVWKGKWYYMVVDYTLPRQLIRKEAYYFWEAHKTEPLRLLKEKQFSPKRDTARKSYFAKYLSQK